MSHSHLHRIMGAAGLIGAFCMLGCSSAPTSRLEELLGTDTIAILQEADTVEPFRIDPDSVYTTKPEDEGKMRIGGFVVTANAKPLGKEFAQQLSAILLEPDTYKHASAKCFDPG